MNPASGPQPWATFSAANLAYAEELYEKFMRDPEAVDAQTRAWFLEWGEPGAWQATTSATGPPTQDFDRAAQARIAAAALRLLDGIRTFGHLAARIDPLGDAPHALPMLEPSYYGLAEAELRQLPALTIWPEAPDGVVSAADAAEHLRRVYTGSTAYEFSHIHDAEQLAWLRRHVMHPEARGAMEPGRQRALLARLIRVNEFETFLHRTFVGQKRFSIEGLDALVPMLDELVHLAGASGAHDVMVGMAHRGRLNVLAHVLEKPYVDIFAEFHAAPDKELVPSEGSMGINAGWTGDVKYHLGARTTIEEFGPIHVTLANNPSHLEFVDPVVEGFTRAAQDVRDTPGEPSQDADSALCVLIHGDAAFPGEGIVPETLNLSALAGFGTGGTIHLIANNGVGFTAEADQGRSTLYASDLAKGFAVPIVHVNADDPEACLSAVKLAHAYRQRFARDFMIDLIGYRRFGHNEMDDPSFTQPLTYERVAAHPRVSEVYAARLREEGVVAQAQIEAMVRLCRDELDAAHGSVAEAERRRTRPPRPAPVEAPPTQVDGQRLRELYDSARELPHGFSVYPKLARVIDRRTAAFEPEGRVDWAFGEWLALASILADGIPVRMTGQDSERGTFSQRHLVWHDTVTGETFCPLQAIDGASASFAVYNSPLSEASVLGFEYGYSVQAPEALVIWEAQYGDFANAAQVIIDQFLSSGGAKWRQESGLVLLLPHGYEGQGPEHSSARLERYLELSAEHNWMVAYPTDAAQYFHLLRRQAHMLARQARPLIVMAPKSLLRHAMSASPLAQFTDGRFEPVLDGSVGAGGEERVKRVILCSGRIVFDLLQARDAAPDEIRAETAVIRLEQLYPFPEAHIDSVFQRYSRATQVVWLQEEPANMGAWPYVQRTLARLSKLPGPVQCVSRPARSSPAEGIPDMHQETQRRLLQGALGQTKAHSEEVLAQ